MENKPVVTAKQIIARYNVTGKDLFYTRRMLEELGYIEQIRKGSQTYWQHKELPESIGALDTEYLATNYTFVLPEAFYTTLKELDELSAALVHWQKYLSERGTTKAAGQASMVEAGNALLRTALEILRTITIPEEAAGITFTSVPTYDNILIQHRIGYKKQLQNLADRLEHIAVAVSKLSMARTISTAVDMLNTIELPDVFNVAGRTKHEA